MEKIALITGATKGMGLETAMTLGKEGYTIVLNGRNEKEGLVAVSTLEAAGIKAELSVFDVTDETAVTNAVNEIGKKYGKIDALINNAGGLGGRSRFEEMTTDFYKSVLALNLDSAFYASRAAIPFLKKSDYASIVNVTSIAANNAGGPGAGIYGVSKAGVTTLTRALAKDLAEYGIRVNAVSPGTIDTDFHKQIKTTKPEVFASWKNNILLGRLGDAKEVASVTKFLVSKDASFVTGELIQINGGQAFI